MTQLDLNASLFDNVDTNSEASSPTTLAHYDTSSDGGISQTSTQAHVIITEEAKEKPLKSFMSWIRSFDSKSPEGRAKKAAQSVINPKLRTWVNQSEEKTSLIDPDSREGYEFSVSNYQIQESFFSNYHQLLWLCETKNRPLS